MENVYNKEKIKNIVENIKNKIMEEQDEEKRTKWLKKFDNDINDIDFESLTNSEEVFGKLQYIKAVIQDHFHYFVCTDCEKIEDISNSYEIDINYVICNECYDNDYCTCCECGEILHREDAVYCHDTEQHFCQTCADDSLTFCEHCENYVLNEDIRRVYTYYTNGDDFRYICISCIENDYNDNYHCCDECGAYVEDYSYIEEDDSMLCGTCYEEYNRRNGGNICNYSYKPTPIFYATKEEEGKNQSIAYFGVELEIDRHDREGNKRDMLEELEGIFGDFAYYKRDGSLSNDGLEIVTHPASLKKWQQEKEKTKKAFEACVKAGYRSHNTSTCGLHIHANRKYLAEDRDEQDAIIDRIILILETFKKQVKKFSRRNNYSYCYFLSDNIREENKEEFAKKIENIKREKGAWGRYVTLNIQNYNTIELRVMRGTLNIETFYACLQFFNNVIEIAKNNTLEQLNGLQWNNIIELGDFEELQAYNEKRNIENDTILTIRKEKGEN